MGTEGSQTLFGAKLLLFFALEKFVLIEKIGKTHLVTEQAYYLINNLIKLALRNCNIALSLVTSYDKS